MNQSAFEEIEKINSLIETVFNEKEIPPPDFLLDRLEKALNEAMTTPWVHQGI